MGGAGRGEESWGPSQAPEVGWWRGQILGRGRQAREPQTQPGRERGMWGGKCGRIERQAPHQRRVVQHLGQLLHLHLLHGRPGGAGGGRLLLTTVPAGGRCRPHHPVACKVVATAAWLSMPVHAVKTATTRCMGRCRCHACPRVGAPGTCRHCHHLHATEEAPRPIGC